MGNFAFAIRFGSALAMVGLSVPATAQDVATWQQSPIIFLPGTAIEGEGTFLEGNLILEMPLRWALSTRLAQQVVVTAGGISETIAAGTLLPIVRI